MMLKQDEFLNYLKNEEKSDLTIEKYLRDVGAFSAWLGERQLDKLAVMEYKAWLTERYAVGSVNSIADFQFLSKKYIIKQQNKGERHDVRSLALLCC